MSRIVLFGTGKIAEVVHYFFTYESPHEVVAFTCEEEYIDERSKFGKPITPFAGITEKYSPEKFEMFVALGYQDMNRLRRRIIEEAEEKGYGLLSYVHPDSGKPETVDVGKNCFIMNNVHIQPEATIGDNVFIWSGAIVGHHATIGNHNWVTSGANISGSVTTGDHCFFAVNTTISHEVTIGNNCFLGANALVTKDLEDDTVVISSPSKPFRLKTDQFLRMTQFE